MIANKEGWKHKEVEGEKKLFEHRSIFSIMKEKNIYIYIY